MANIVIFASGSGTNAENIIRNFENNENATVVAVFCNNPDAYVLTRAKNLGVESVCFDKSLLEGGTVLELLQKKQADLIVLAGFLWKIPDNIISAYSSRIINIHPALLPKYGGKGMYGMNVHREVFKNRENHSGITIHFVNEFYDEGNIIFQKECNIENCKSPEEIAEEIHKLEYQYFPGVIEKFIETL